MNIPRLYARASIGVLLALSMVADALLEGEGRELVERSCQKFHTLEVILKKEATRVKWAGIVDDMVARGASASEREIEIIINYLATHFGPSKNDGDKSN
jgi:hypothetical protein